jgi:hypothetical protein
VSDLFGDEAKGLMPLIQNTELLSKALAMVGDKSKYAGSTQDEYFKRLQTATQQAKLAENNVNILAITFGQSLAPALTKLIQALTPVIEGFTWLLNNVPGLGPILGALGGAFVAIVAVAPAIASFIYSFKALGLTLGVLGAPLATIAGYLGALGPVVAAIGSALSGLGTILVGVFTGPVGWVALLVAAGVAIYAFRDQVGAAINAIVELYKQFFTMIYNNFIKPYMDAHAALTQYIVENFIKPTATAISGFATAAYQYISTNFIEPAKKVFTAVTTFISEKFVKPVQDTINGMIKNIGTAFQSIKDAITKPFEIAMQTMKGIVNSILNGIGNAISSVVNAINNVIKGANGALATLKLPQISYLPQPQLPKFAKGGVVDSPTLAMVGEGGEREYIIPESKMARASANYMNGARGGAVIPAFANGGVVGPSRMAQGRNSTATIKPQISIQTGPVMQMNGTNYVTMQDLGRAVQTGVRQTLNIIQGDMNMRSQMGLT